MEKCKQIQVIYLYGNVKISILKKRNIFVMNQVINKRGGKER